MNVDYELIKKYNVSGPRYTSYPTAVHFKESFDADEYEQFLLHHNRGPKKLSLYFHIPFCFSLCWYCGCTKVVTRDKDRGPHYLNYLEKEMDMLLPYLHRGSKVIQLHFGGGTPTFLKPEDLRRLGEAIHKRFNFEENAEISVEIDPRRLTREQVSALSESGFNRASLGIQDTNYEVQEAVHRIQPHKINVKVIDWLRNEGFESINVDLIYGLPRQNLSRFRKTINDVQQLDPDRLAVYSYAHVPWIKPSQKLLNEKELPDSREKLLMLKHAIERLTREGYRYIGMDHFAKRDDELAKAFRNNTLQRNFQGYSTHREADLYAFGMSGISQVDTLYTQNYKEIGEYYEKLDQTKWPRKKSYRLTRDDQIRRDLIMRIMCKNFVFYNRFEDQWDIRFRRYFGREIDKLDMFEQDGLIKRLDNGFGITRQGRLFIRNLAMIFDAYYQSEKDNRRIYSKTV